MRRYGVIYKRKVKPLTRMKIYIRGRYKPLRRRRGLLMVRLTRKRWVRVIRGKRAWYYINKGRMTKVKSVRLTARVGRRTCRIRPRGRRLYARIGRSLRRIKTRFIRFIRYGKKRLRVKRRGKKVIVGRRGKWTRPLRVKRFRKCREFCFVFSCTSAID